MDYLKKLYATLFGGSPTEQQPAEVTAAGAAAAAKIVDDLWLQCCVEGCGHRCRKFFCAVHGSLIPPPMVAQFAAAFGVAQAQAAEGGEAELQALADMEAETKRIADHLGGLIAASANESLRPLVSRRPRIAGGE